MSIDEDNDPYLKPKLLDIIYHFLAYLIIHDTTTYLQKLQVDSPKSKERINGLKEEVIYV